MWLCIFVYFYELYRICATCCQDQRKKKQEEKGTKGVRRILCPIQKPFLVIYIYIIYIYILKYLYYIYILYMTYIIFISIVLIISYSFRHPAIGYTNSTFDSAAAPGAALGHERDGRGDAPSDSMFRSDNASIGIDWSSFSMHWLCQIWHGLTNWHGSFMFFLRCDDSN